MDISARLLGFTLHGSAWVLWLLIALSVISLAVMLERFWFLAVHETDPHALEKDMRKLLRGRGTSPSAETLAGAMAGAKARERLRLERNLAFLGTLGSNAPFIGLFGTVLGIIKAFQDLAGNAGGRRGLDQHRQFGRARKIPAGPGKLSIRHKSHRLPLTAFNQK